MTDVSEQGLDLRDVAGIESWVNPQWKEDLQSDPAGAMRALAEKYGLDLPADMTFEVHEDTSSVYHIVLTPSPAGFSPAESASEVQGYLSSLSVGGTEDYGRVTTSAGIFCNKAICSHTTTQCCIKAPG